MEFQVEIPFARLLGLELVEVEPGRAVLALPLRHELTNSFQVAHGGATMALLDVAMAHAARSPHTPGGPWMPGVVTIEMKTSFLLPGEGRLVATARCLRRTASLAFCEAGVARADGELVAHGTGTFKFLRGLPAIDGGREVRRLRQPAVSSPSTPSSP